MIVVEYIIVYIHKLPLCITSQKYPHLTPFIMYLTKYNMENDMRPAGWGSRGPKPKQLVTGEIEGIKCGWDGIVIPPDQVYDLAVLGLNNKEIGRFYNVSDATIARNFAAELQKGREMTKIKLRRAMMKNACDHMNAAVQIFLAKAVLGMSETSAESVAPLPWGDDLPEVDNQEEIMYNTDNVKET